MPPVASASAAPATTPKLASSRHQEMLALLPAGWLTRKEGRKLVEPLLTGSEEALVLGHGRRQLLWFEVTRHPTAEWLARQITEAFP